MEWVLNAGIAAFYRDLRWPGRETDVSALSIDEGISVYRFLFTAEGRNITTAARKNVPFRELLNVNGQLAERLRAGSG